MKLVTAAQMRELDRAAIVGRGIPGLDLMERAGAVVARCAAAMIREGRLRPRVLLCAGKGNNGGDAFVAARRLRAEGIAVRMLLFAHRGDIARDAIENLRRYEAEGGETTSVETPAELAAFREDAASYGLAVDGILGTGAAGEVSGQAAAAIGFIRELRSPVLAIDVPSGLDATTGAVRGIAVRAAATVAMGLPKTGMVSGDGPAHCGRIRVADIGLPPDLVEAVEGAGDLVVEADLQSLFPPRSRLAHKGDFGHVLVVAGSPGMTGAACLAASAALRSGAGLVTVAAARSLNPVLAAKLTEAMTLPLPETREGALGGEAGEEILRAADRFDAAVIGPGLGRRPETVAMVRALIAALRVPTVVDADGLYALAGDPSILKGAQAPLVLTPHPGEMARLAGGDAAGVLRDRRGAAEGFARLHGAVVVLKGMQTLVVSPGGGVSINASGNPGMATAGSGDVLSGVIASFLGQQMDQRDAARAAVFVHGDAGDRAAMRLGERGMTASDIVERLPAAVEALVRGDW